MVDELNERNRMIRSALATAASDPERAIQLLSATLDIVRAGSVKQDIALVAKHLAVLCDARGDRHAALALYQEASAADAADPHVHFALGTLLADLNHVDEARAALGTALSAAMMTGEEDLVTVLRQTLAAMRDGE
jgi:tetratricopeptide (TPR) repeat protein